LNNDLLIELVRHCLLEVSKTEISPNVFADFELAARKVIDELKANATEDK
jgi:hypothetical protein